MTNETVTDAEIHELLDNSGDLPTFHPILQVWREVLKNARGELTAKVTPSWANKVVSSYQGVTYADMVDYRDSFFTKLIMLLDILEMEIASDEDCLSYITPEEDVLHNSYHYRNLLMQWQLQLLQWELEWETTSPTAAVEIAAISEIHKIIFGPTGITQYLDNIKFEFDEADQAELAEALTQLKEGQ